MKRDQVMAELQNQNKLHAVSRIAAAKIKNKPLQKTSIPGESASSSGAQSFSQLVAKLFSSPEDAREFERLWPADMRMYFPTIYPHIRKTFKGAKHPDPQVVLTMAESYATKNLGA